MVVKSETLENITDDAGFWAGIADSHKVIQYMLAELVDDSISSIISNEVGRKDIVITINECPKEDSREHFISIEDSGAGIKNLNACFSFACTNGKESYLNKYGVGMKKVLATFDPSNTNWRIYTRNSKEATKEKYRLIEAPYKVNGMIVKDIASEAWKGILNGSGTYIEFPCTKDMLATAGKEYCIHKGTFSQYIDCIKEELSVIYTPLLKKIGISIIEKHSNGNKKEHYLRPLTPNWDYSSPYDEGTEIVDFGKGLCKVSYKIGKIKNHKETKRFFQKNLKNSGVMVYENGRLIESNIFETIWVKNHPKFNSFLAVIEIEPVDNPEALPLVSTTKDSLVYGDERVTALYSWIKKICPHPDKYKKAKDSNNDSAPKLTEAQKCKLLVEWLKNKYGKKAVIKQELSLYDFLERSHPKLDIYLYAEKEITLIECKAEDSTSKDLFQLIMYHIGAIHDLLLPSTLWLVAERHPDSVKELTKHLNTCKDPKGICFNIVLKTWNEFGI